MTDTKFEMTEQIKKDYLLALNHKLQSYLEYTKKSEGSEIVNSYRNGYIAGLEDAIQLVKYS